MGVESLKKDILEIESLMQSKFILPDVDQAFKGKPVIFWTHHIMKIATDIKNIQYMMAAMNGEHQKFFGLDLD